MPLATLVAVGLQRIVAADAEVAIGRVTHLRIAQVSSPDGARTWGPTGKGIPGAAINGIHNGALASNRIVTITYSRPTTQVGYALIAFKVPGSREAFPSGENTVTAPGGFATKPEKWHALLNVHPPRSQVKTDLTVGVADGPWTLAGRTEFRNGRVTSGKGSPRVLSVEQTHEAKKESFRAHINLPADVGVFVRAYDRSGRRLQDAGSVVLGGVPWIYFLGRLDQVGHVDVVTCPYTWVTFTGVHLDP